MNKNNLKITGNRSLLLSKRSFPVSQKLVHSFLSMLELRRANSQTFSPLYFRLFWCHCSMNSLLLVVLPLHEWEFPKCPIPACPSLELFVILLPCRSVWFHFEKLKPLFLYLLHGLHCCDCHLFFHSLFSFDIWRVLLEKYRLLWESQDYTNKNFLMAKLDMLLFWRDILEFYLDNCIFCYGLML